MVKLKPGDHVDCHIRDNEIISPYTLEYDSTVTFNIIAVTDWGCHLYIPNYICIKFSTTIDKSYCKKWDINMKYVGEQTYYINSSLIYKISFVLDGATCSRCGEFHYQAAVDKCTGIFTCYLCTFNPFRGSQKKQ